MAELKKPVEGIEKQISDLQKAYNQRLAEYWKTQSVTPDANFVEQWNRAAQEMKTKLAKQKEDIADQQRVHQGELAEYRKRHKQREKELASQSALIDKRRASYEALEKEGVEDYCGLVLAKSEYPESFPRDCSVEYITETRILVVEYSLPAPDDLQRLQLSENEANKIYDDVLYQICHRTLYELFEADYANGLCAISFNGWVKSRNRASGKQVNSCILSVQVKKDEFQTIELEHIDPKACFKALKGVGSSKLHSLAAVAPILSMNRQDKRFVAPREVASQLNEGVNVAAIDWEDFEHLIREVFEKEYAQYGGEVKVTRASRDHGVDAIIFDPDVLRGGKIIVQAKRYTNTVELSAVRDLYGTVINEGATKGILVTTANYGAEAYEFAKGKPLVLLNGANLLHLLEKHGHKARIDLQEAKKILAEQEQI